MKIINSKVFKTLLAIFILGIIIGVISFFVIGIKSNNIISYFESIKNDKFNYIYGLFNSVKYNYKALFTIWLCGLVFIFIFIIPFLECFRGICLGFSITLIIYTYKLKGLILALILDYFLINKNNDIDEKIEKEFDNIESDWAHKSICLTGGEPLMLENKDFMLNELLPLFVNAHYDVGIETDGGIDYTDYKEKFGDARIVNAHGDREGVTIIADYKLPHSKMTSLMIKDNFKLYSDMDLVKMVISDDEEDWKELD